MLYMRALTQLWNGTDYRALTLSGHTTKNFLMLTAGRSLSTRGSLDTEGIALSKAAGQDAILDRISKTDALNWDPRSTTKVHYERNCGKCKCRQDAVDLVFASAAESGAVLDSTSTVPMKHRWGSASQAMTEQSVGIFSDLLNTTTQAAFPTWNDGATGEEDDDDIKTKNKRKVWRSKRVLDDKRIKARIMSIVFSTPHLDWLWLRLQHRDEGTAPGILLEMCTPDSQNPFLYVEKELAAMVMGPAPDLQTLWWFYSQDPLLKSEVPEMTLQIIGSAAALLEAEFNDVFFDWPFGLLLMLYFKDALEVTKKFHKAFRCCLEPLMAEKIRDLFDSPEAMANDKDLSNSLKAWARKAKITNMHIERLFPLIFYAAGKPKGSKQAVLLEALCSSGLLGQFLKEHVKAGGDDPRLETRSKLKRENVAIKADKVNSKTSRRGGTPPWMLYAFDEMAKAEDPQSQTLDEYRKRLKRHAEDFRSLDEEQQEEYKQKASKGKDARQASKGLASFPFEASKGAQDKAERIVDDSHLWTSSDLPIPSQRYLQSLIKHWKQPTNVKEGSVNFNSWGHTCRKEFLKHVFIQDKGAIPKATKFSRRMSCMQAHVGVCRTADRKIYRLLMAAGSGCFGYCKDCKYKFVALRHWLDNKCVGVVYAYCVDIRFNKPKRILFLQTQLLGASLIGFCVASERLVVLNNYSIIKKLSELGREISDASRIEACCLRVTVKPPGHSILGHIQIHERTSTMSIFDAEVGVTTK